MILTIFRCLGLLSMGDASGRVSRQLWKSYLIGYNLSANKIISGKRKVDNTCYLIEQITNVINANVDGKLRVLYAQNTGL